MPNGRSQGWGWVRLASPAVPGQRFDRRFPLVVATALAYFVGIGVLVPVLPRYVEEELGGGGAAVGAAVGVFAVSAAALRPWIGRLGDTRGRRVLAVGGCLLAAVSIAGYSLPGGLATLLVLRLVTGAGEAAAFVGAATTAQDMAPPGRRGQAASFFSIAVYGGLGAGPPLGEWVYRHHGPSVAWAVAAGACLVGAALGTRLPRGVVHEVAGSGGAGGPAAGTAGVGREPAGSGTLAAPAGGAAGVAEGTAAGTAGAVPGGAASPAASAAAAGPAEAAGPAVPVGSAGRSGWRGVLHPAALRPGVVLALSACGFAGFGAFVPLYVDEIGVRDAGPALAEYAVIVLVVRILGSLLPDVLGSRTAPLLALVLQGAGLVVLAGWASPTGLYAGTAVFAAGVSLLYPALFPVVVDAAPEHERSQAIATFTLFFDIAMGAGAPLLGLVVTLTDERGAFVAAAVLAAVGFAIHRSTPLPARSDPVARPA